MLETLSSRTELTYPRHQQSFRVWLPMGLLLCGKVDARLAPYVLLVKVNTLQQAQLLKLFLNDDVLDLCSRKANQVILWLHPESCAVQGFGRLLLGQPSTGTYNCSNCNRTLLMCYLPVSVSTIWLRKTGSGMRCCPRACERLILCDAVPRTARQ